MEDSWNSVSHCPSLNQVPWQTPLTREPIGDGRSFLGGSPRQIAEDLMAARESVVTQVYLAGGQGLGLDVGLKAADVARVAR